MDNDELDARTRALIERNEIERATERVLRAYGGELARWLRSILPSEADAQDAFSRMSEELWKSLPRFDGRCAVRTWCYMLARHAASRVRSHPSKDRELLVSQIPSIQHAMTNAWSNSMVEAKRVRDVYAEIRATLEDEDQTLLALRVDRDLSWREIALVLLGEDAASDEIDKKAASLRKQFERVKERLKQLAADRVD
ncbi:MAG TPA: sigma-70 family RNA polymerase sigma factor [Kofleriaceae bacterium]|nr:sigma-70 family RNA polymerase sigma factor [Kofleriaceae bacterium]